jgi:SAM-dependent methyltransferase
VTRDRSAGDHDYDSALTDARSVRYAARRRTDPRIAAHVWAALGDARTVLNVGAGAGSYEPPDRYVVAVEPSAAMRAQRATPAVDAAAEALPFGDDSFDAVMATVTVHQWRDLVRGLAELRRVARGPVVVLTFDGPAVQRFWLSDYVPEWGELESSRYPDPERIAGLLGGTASVTGIPIPLDCSDGFIEAFYGRPEALLDPSVRGAQSAWSFVAPDAVAAGVERLRGSLVSGEWDRRLGHLRTQEHYDGALRLVTAG